MYILNLRDFNLLTYIKCISLNWSFEFKDWKFGQIIKIYFWFSSDF